MTTTTTENTERVGTEPAIYGHGSMLYREDNSQRVAIGPIFANHGAMAEDGTMPAYEPDGYVGMLDRETIDTHNSALSGAMADSIKVQQPDRIAAYVNVRWQLGQPVVKYGQSVTLWDGEQIGRVLNVGSAHWTFGDARRVWLRVAIGAATYGGYATSARDLIFLRKLKD